MKEKMKRLKNNLKNNKYFIIVMLIFSSLFLYEISKVVMYADDYQLAFISKTNGINGAINESIRHYKEWGGGWTPFLVILIFIKGIKTWYIIGTLVMITIVILSYKIIKSFNDNDDNINVLILIEIWLLYFCINIYTLRETIMWVDGFIGYVFVAMQLLAFIYIMINVTNNKNISIRKYILFSIIAFFSGWSSAQTGILVVYAGLSILIYNFIKEKNKNIKHQIKIFILELCGLIGYCIFYFAPGNMGRMQHFPEFVNLNVIEKIAYKCNSVFSLMFDYNSNQFFGVPIYIYALTILTIIIMIYYIKKEQNRKIKYLLIATNIVSICFVIGFTLCCGDIFNSTVIKDYFYTYNNLLKMYEENKISIKSILPYVFALLNIVNLLCSSLYISIKNKKIIFFTLVSSALIGQGIMVMAPVHPLRATFLSIMLLIPSIIILVNIFNNEKIEYFFGVVLLIYLYSSKLALFVIIVYFIIKDIYKKRFINEIIISVSLIISTINYIDVTVAYKKNKDIDNLNTKNIIYAKNNKLSEVKYYRRYEYTYGFTFPEENEWAESLIKEYYGLPSNTIFNYIDYDDSKV